MAKKGRNPAAEPNAATPVPSRDSLQRLSFLYQASSALRQASRQQQQDKRKGPTARSTAAHGTGRSSSSSPAAPPPSRRPHPASPPRPPTATGTAAAAAAAAAALPPPQRPSSRDRRVARDDPLALLARHLAQQMSEVAKKATVRMCVTSIYSLPCFSQLTSRLCAAGTPASSAPSARAAGQCSCPACRRACGSSVRVQLCCASPIVHSLTQVPATASRPHAHLVAHRCLSCRSERRLPAPPHLADPPPLEPADSVAPLVKRAPASGRTTKRERREARQARAPVFFEREGHVFVRGSELVVRDALQ